MKFFAMAVLAVGLFAQPVLAAQNQTPLSLMHHIQQMAGGHRLSDSCAAPPSGTCPAGSCYDTDICPVNYPCIRPGQRNIKFCRPAQ